MPLPMMPTPITLLTDFGSRDAYVGAMKGVLASLATGHPTVDLTHEIAPQDVMEGAFVLREAYAFYPLGTVHLAVVDPGVGTERRAIAMHANGHTFVGPDNGLFALVLGDDLPDEVVVLDRPEVWRVPNPSATFHGRDVFAPVAARLARGATLADVGTPIDAMKVLRWPLPLLDRDGVRGRVVHLDRFGNAVTNIAVDELMRRRNGRKMACVAGGEILRGLRRTYSDVAPGEPLLLAGAGGMVEVAVRNGNAADLLGLERGSSVSFQFADHEEDLPGFRRLSRSGGHGFPGMDATA